MKPKTFTDQETATILFALRNLQQDIIGDSQFRGNLKNAEHFSGGIQPLSLEEIDALAERINHG